MKRWKVSALWAPNGSLILLKARHLINGGFALLTISQKSKETLKGNDAVDLIMMKWMESWEKNDYII